MTNKFLFKLNPTAHVLNSTSLLATHTQTTHQQAAAMPNGRSHSQRSRAANARRNRARDRRASARPAAAPQRPAITRLMNEIEATDPDICTETVVLRAIRRFVIEGHANRMDEVVHLAEGFINMVQEFAEFEAVAVESLRHEVHWGCPAAVIETAVKNMRAAGLPKSIADALYEAQMPKPTTATKTTKMHGINPEPAPTDCMTCCEPFDQQKLIKCKTPNCTYLQCISCVIKGGGGACARPSCMQVHMDCPQCRESQHLSSPQGGCMQLKELPSDLLVVTLDNIRERLKKHVEESVSEMTDVVNEMTDQLQLAVNNMMRVG